jgi:eukaryotic-like serine/threonine-protein kinase
MTFDNGIDAAATMVLGMFVEDSHSLICNALRFDRFLVLVESGVLLRDEARIRIQDLPFRLLLLLLEAPGQVISTEELGRRLGRPESPLELGSLRVAATKLREALGDDATRPRFIQTVSGQGYKFIATVAPVSEPVPPKTELSAETPELPVPERGPLASADLEIRAHEFPQTPPGKLPLSRRSVVWAAAALAAVIFGSAIWMGFHMLQVRRQEAALSEASEPGAVVLGGFLNETGNHEMDETLSSALQVKMEESPFLRLVPNRKFRSIVHSPETATLSEELNACRSLEGHTLLRGQLSLHKSGQEVAVTAWTCSDGQPLDTQKIEANTTEDILPALSLVAEQMRRRLGEPNDILQKFHVPLSQATTSSLAALRAFTQGEEKRSQGLESESIHDYSLAADLDPQFALAFARLGAIYFNAGEYVLSQQNFEKAFALRGRTTDRERLYITANYYGCATGEINRAIEAYELWHKIYPQDIAPINNLAIEYLLVGQPEKAVALAKTAIQLDPTAYLQYGTWVQAYLKVGDFASLNALCDGPMGQQNNSPVFHMHCFQGAYAQNNEVALQRHLQWAQGKPQQGLLLQEAAMVALCRGMGAESWRLFQKTEDVGLRNGMTEFAAGTMLNEATFKADVGMTREARLEVQSAFKLTATGADLDASASLALARAGGVTDAQAEATRAASESPLNTLLNLGTLASTRAAVAMNRRDPATAIQALEVSRPYDLNEFMLLSPAYYRGLAYLQSKRPADATKEFQRVLDHRVMAPESPYIPLAQLELGRAYQLSGDHDRAAIAFRRMDELWKRADADFPPLKQLHRYELELASQL